MLNNAGIPISSTFVILQKMCFYIVRKMEGYIVVPQGTKTDINACCNFWWLYFSPKKKNAETSVINMDFIDLLLTHVFFYFYKNLHKDISVL